MKTNLRTIIACAAAFVAVSMPARADEKVYVEYHDGSVYSYILASKPKVTFAGDVISVNGAEIADTHKMADVKHFKFTEPGSVSDISANEYRLVFTDNANVQLAGFGAGTGVTVYDLSGSALAGATVADDGTATVSVATMAPGVYVIATTEGKSYKVIKR